MRRVVSLLGVCIAAVIGPRQPYAQEQFPGDPVPYTIGPFVTQQFMQLDNISLQRLHTGIDVFTGGGEAVVAPIIYGSRCRVIAIGPDYVMLQALNRQGGKVAVYRAQHIVPDQNLVLNTDIQRNTLLGTVDNVERHLHSEIFLVSSSTDQGNQFLVHPQRNAFAVVEGWNVDTYAPKVDVTVVHAATAGNPTVFEIHAYDQANMRPDCYDGIYAIRLYVDDVLVDSLKFDRMRAKNGNYPPSASEYYYCTTTACTPTGLNNPNVLQYKLSWTTQAGDHIWRLDVLDAKGNLLHGDPRNGLPGREMPAVSMGGTIEDGKVHLTWRIDPTDVEEAGIETFGVWQSTSHTGDYQKANAEPILATAGQGSYDFIGDAPAGSDSVWYRLTAENTVGSTLMLGETGFGIPALVDDLAGYPNPIADRYTISLSLVHRGTGEVAIFDLNGRRVRTVHHGSLEPGVTRLVWDGRDDEGHSLPNGVYLLKVRTERGPEFGARKIALFR